MSVILTYAQVSVVGDVTQFFVDGVTLDEVLVSGGAAVTNDARLIITTSVPDTFTLDFTVNFEHLPNDFSDIIHRHIAVCTTDAAGPCVALFFSKVGVAYAGSFHHDSGGNLVLDSTFQDLPNSQTLVSENEYWSYRVAADLLTGVVYIYITKTADLISIGHQLQYIMPVIPATALTHPATDRTIISVRGTQAQPAELSLDSICLSSSLVIPNVIPVADAGLDQAARVCSIVQLDGSRSFDPEGSNLTYRWRLIEAPLGSMFIFDGVDGKTFPLPMPTGFTNKFYSTDLGTLDAMDPIDTTLHLGDVLVVSGAVYDIIGKGTDLNGFYVQVDGYVLPDSFTNVAFKLFRQRGISGPTTVKPTFFPDLPGIFRFDLKVFDGALYSEASVVLVNVTESPIPRGCIPDAKFLWGYLSDFWRLVEDKERIDVFWSAAAQVAASELLSLWQIDYSKSLRDVQRTFQRRWLNYELTLNEPFPELASLRPIFGGLRQLFPPQGLAGLPGKTISFTIPVFDGQGASALLASYTFTGSGLLTAQQVSEQLAPFLAKLDSRFKVTLTSNRPGTFFELRIDAPFTFFTGSTDTAPIFQNATNEEPQGSGAGVGVNTYRTDRTLQNFDIKEGDLLTLDGITYRIRGLTDDPSDEWPYQRITMLDNLPTSPDTSWLVPGTVTSKVVDFYNSHVDVQDLVFFEVFDRQTRLISQKQLQGAYVPESNVRTFGITGLGILANYTQHPTRKYNVLFRSVTRLTHLPIDELIVDIPYLQSAIHSTDDTAVLRRNIDFFLEEFRGRNSIHFAFEGFDETDNIWESADLVPKRLWAETTYIDNRPVIEQNFGIPVDFTLDDLAELPSNVDYLSAVRGLWYSYFNGPTLFNLRAGTQILLGLPFAEEAGTIVEIRTDFDATQGRILIRDKKNTEIVRSYNFPKALALETNPLTDAPYAVGDKVSQFAPLVTGVEVDDYVKDPLWFQGYLQQGVFYEVEKFFKFLVRVDSAAFNLAALLFVQSFVLKIKPTFTTPLFVVLKKIGDNGDTEVSTTDLVLNTGTLLLFDGACFQFNGASDISASTMVDEPNPAGGGWQSQFDTDNDPSTSAPVYPTSQPTVWGADHELMCPEDFMLAKCCTVYAAPALPMVDSVFVLDSEIDSSLFALFEDSWVTYVPPAGGIRPTPDVTIGSNGTITDVKIDIVGDPDLVSTNYQLIINKNGVDQAPINFTQSTSVAFSFHSAVAINVLIGDVIYVKIQSAGVTGTSPLWKSIKVELSISTAWVLDVNLPAATYCAYKVM